VAVDQTQLSLRTKQKKLWKPTVRLLITGLALFFILRTVDLSAILPLFASAHYLYVGLVIGLTLLMRVLMAWKWKLLLYYGGIELSLGYLLRIILISGFMGILLPSGVGADIIRTAAVGRRTDYTSAAMSTIADRVMGVVAMALWSLTATLIALWTVPNLQQVLWPIAALGAGVMAILVTLLSYTTMRIVQRVLDRSRAGANRKQEDSSGLRRLIRFVMNKAVFIHHELRGLLAKPQVFISVFCLNILVQGGRIVRFYLLFHVVGAHVAFVYHVIFAPIIAFLALLPFSFLGIGVKEVAIVFFYKQVGVDPTAAFTVSLWTYIVSILPLAIGGFLYLLGTPSAAAETNKEKTTQSQTEREL
jgi:uncharacterized protein (TIRG00374 family)